MKQPSEIIHRPLIEYDDSEASHYINRGKAYISLENYRSAIADFSEAITLNPEDVAAYVFRGEVYLLQENYSDALTNLDTAIELDPENRDGLSTTRECKCWTRTK